MKITKKQFIEKQKQCIKQFNLNDFDIKHDVENMIFDRVEKKYSKTKWEELCRILDLILKN